jgi:Na+-transporting methylmalonyl-CoA/oxaloacetate decarboxylase gamma subunit
MVPLAIPLNNDTVSPGFLGLGVVVALGIALYLLIRSMNRQISRIDAPKEADLKQAEWEAAQAKPPAEKAEN